MTFYIDYIKKICCDAFNMFNIITPKMTSLLWKHPLTRLRTMQTRTLKTREVDFASADFHV